MFGELVGLILCTTLAACFIRAALDEGFFRRHFNTWAERNYSLWSRGPSSLLTGGSLESYIRRTRVAWGVGGVIMGAACIAWPSPWVCARSARAMYSAHFSPGPPRRQDGGDCRLPLASHMASEGDHDEAGSICGMAREPG